MDLSMTTGEKVSSRPSSLSSKSLSYPHVHELQEHLDFAIVVEHVMALHHIGVVHIAEDLDLGAKLAGHGGG